MPDFTTTIQAEQWTSEKEITGVEPEAVTLAGGEPEVTHGLTLIVGRPPIVLKEKLKVGDTFNRRGHYATPDGHTLLLYPGDWLVKHGDDVTVLTDEQFKAKYKGSAT